MARKPWFPLMAASAALLGLGFWLGLRQGAFGGATVVVVDVVSFVLPLSAAGACWWRAGVTGGRTRHAWRMVALACAAWALGQAAWATYELGLGVEVPAPSLADVGYLALIPFAAAGLLLFSLDGPAVSRVRSVLDGSVLASSLLFVSATTTLGAAWTSTDVSELGRWVLVAYPLGDVVLATLALHALARAPAGSRLAYGLLSSGVLAIALADSGFLYLNLLGSFRTGTVIDAGWVWGFQLIGLAAVAPRPPAVLPYDRPTRMGAVLPLAAFGLGTVASCIHVARHGFLSGPLFWIAITVVVLFLARTTAFLLENLALRREVEEALAMARRAEEARTHSLRAVSHDLNNPLTPIQLQLAVLRQRHPLPDDARHFDLVERNLRQLRRLATDLRDLTRIEGGRLELDLEDEAMDRVVGEAADSWQVDAASRGIRFESAVEPVRAVVDAVRLRQVVDNLVSNALKFTPRGGLVRLLARRVGDAVRIEVQDSGRGLDDEERSRLFRPFTQVHDRRTQAPTDRGMGLGLTVAKGIVEAHGGSIGVSSPGRGRGSTFWMVLPTRAAAVVDA